MKIQRTFRPFALVAALVAVAAAFVFLFGSGPSAPHGAQAAGTPQKSVSCADIWQDISNDTPLGSAHDGNDVLAASSLSRLDVPSQNGGDADLTSVTYLGPDLVVGDDTKTGGTAVGNDTDIGTLLVAGDLIPDTAPVNTLCLPATTGANTAAEAGTFNARMNFTNQYNNRPSLTGRFGTYDATNSEDGAGAGTCGDAGDNGGEGVSGYSLNAIAFDATDTQCYDFPGTGADTLVFSGCAYSESGAYWGRTDVFTKIVNKTPKSVNYGRSLLFIATDVPTTALIDSNGDTVGDTASNPNECSGGLGFPAVIESTAREITTDQGTGGKNTGLTADPDTGTARDSADTYADDWDGDGCTDWDELDKNFTGSFPVSVTGTVNGTDPFNPNDCDKNLDSTISILTTVTRDNSNAFLGTGNGNYFKCIADASDPKGGGTRTITLRLGCYSDSPFTVINSSYAEVPFDGTRREGAANPVNSCSNSADDDGDGKIDTADSDCHTPTCGPAPASMCGDGKAGGSPPSSVCLNVAGQCTGAYVGIDIMQYPVVTSATCASTPAANCYDPTANTLSLGGCFAGLGGPAFGPNVYGDGSFNTLVGAGAFTITIKIPGQADCLNGPPFTSCVNPGVDDCLPVIGTATYVELGSKKTLAGAAIPIPLQKNSDRDGCSDTQELRSNQLMGGYRDPYDSYDYLDPNGDKIVRIADILATVGQFHIDDPAGDIDYASLTDRTGIPGANAWNLGPPNGQQRIDDILATVKQFHHDCVS